MRLLLSLATCFALFCITPESITYAQAANNEPIYLDEPADEPPPRIVKQNKVQQKYEDGTLLSEQQVVQLSDETILNHGTYSEFYPDGQKFVEGTYENGLHIGNWQYWHSNGQLCKVISFTAGRPNGQWETFRADGTKESEKQYLNGLRHGEWTRYADDGKQLKVLVTYENGKIEGDRVTYFPNGQMHQKITFKNGLMDGTMTNWNENGEKTAEATFKEGKISGEVVRFDTSKSSQ